MIAGVKQFWAVISISVPVERLRCEWAFMHEISQC